MLSTLSVVIGYFYLPEGQLSGEFLGLGFRQEAIVFVGSQVIACLGLVAGIYLLGGGFLRRLKAAFEWREE